MTIENAIKRKLEENLEIHKMELVNESHKHAGHAGDDGSGQTHFKLMVVSPDFHGCNRIQRQRMIYDLLKEEFSDGLHALNLTLMCPEEEKQ